MKRRPTHPAGGDGVVHADVHRVELLQHQHAVPVSWVWVTGVTDRGGLHGRALRGAEGVPGVQQRAEHRGAELHEWGWERRVRCRVEAERRAAEGDPYGDPEPPHGQHPGPELRGCVWRGSVMRRCVLLDGESEAAAEDRARPGAAEDLEHPPAEHHAVVRPEEAGDHQRHLRYYQHELGLVPLFVQPTHQDTTVSISPLVPSRDW